jgi:hypothetical protein
VASTIDAATQELDFVGGLDLAREHRLLAVDNPMPPASSARSMPISIMSMPSGSVDAV